MKKFIRQLTIFSLIFIMTFGVGFSSQKGINVQAATTQTTTTNDGKLRKNGVLFTGISDNKYYKRGVFTKYTGWKNWKGNRYYLKKGKAVTGWKYLRDYSGSRTKYKYYFKKNGRLSKDLFKTFGSSYKKKRMKLELNLVTHNITFLLYDGKTNKYDIPAKTVVCSTARDGRSTWKPLSFQRNCPLLVHLQKKQPLALLPVGSIRKGNTQLDSFRDVPRHKQQETYRKYL